MRRLAEKIEYSPGTIYLHFADKAEVFEAVCEETFQQLSSLFDALINSADTPINALRNCCRAYIQFGLKHPAQYKVAFMVDSRQMLAPEEVLQRFPRAMQAFFKLRTTVGTCIMEGYLSDEDADLRSQIIWAGLHGLTGLLIVKSSFPWCEQEQLVDSLINALVPQSGISKAIASAR